MKKRTFGTGLHRDSRLTMDNWKLAKLKSFCTAKETISPVPQNENLC